MDSRLHHEIAVIRIAEAHAAAAAAHATQPIRPAHGRRRRRSTRRAAARLALR